MAFGNTFVLPLVSGSKTLIKINAGDAYAGEYYLRETLVSYRAKIRHSTVTRGGLAYDRHNVEITCTVFATLSTPEFVRKVYVVFENLASDAFTEHVDALADWMIVSSNANLASLVGWES